MNIILRRLPRNVSRGIQLKQPCLLISRTTQVSAVISRIFGPYKPTGAEFVLHGQVIGQDLGKPEVPVEDLRKSDVLRKRHRSAGLIGPNDAGNGSATPAAE